MASAAYCEVLVNFLHGHPSLPPSISLAVFFPFAEGNVLHVGILSFTEKSEEQRQNVRENG